MRSKASQVVFKTASAFIETGLYDGSVFELLAETMLIAYGDRQTEKVKLPKVAGAEPKVELPAPPQKPKTGQIAGKINLRQAALSLGMVPNTLKAYVKSLGMVVEKIQGGKGRYGYQSFLLQEQVSRLIPFLHNGIIGQSDRMRLKQEFKNWSARSKNSEMSPSGREAQTRGISSGQQKEPGSL